MQDIFLHFKNDYLFLLLSLYPAPDNIPIIAIGAIEVIPVLGFFKIDFLSSFASSTPAALVFALLSGF